MITVPYEVKKALRDGMLRKNYRFVVLNDDGTEDFTIDNDNLVSESVNIDERMCSGDTLKFGLCEGSSLEFQYFNHPNITGRRVQVFVDVEYEKVITEYVWETQAEFDTVYTVTDMSGDCRLYTERDNAWNFVYVTENGTTTQIYPTASTSGTVIELGDVTGRTLMVALPVIPAPRASLQLLVAHVGPTILTHPIPMGFFDVKKCSRQASTGIIKATGYNKLQSEYLDAKANNNEAFEYYWDTNDKSITLFEVLNALLQGYAVEPNYNKIEGSGHISGQMVITMGDVAFFDISFCLSQYYGINTPMSYYEWKAKGYSDSDLSELHPFVSTRIWEFNTNKTYRLCKSLMGDFEQFERSVYNRLIAEYDNAHFTDSQGNHVSGQSIVENMREEFSYVVGATVEEQISRSRGGIIYFTKRHDYYSTIMYEYEEEHGIPHTRAVPDFPGYYDHTYKSRELFVDLVPKDFTLSMPLGFGVISGELNDTHGFIHSTIDGMNYPYLINNRYGYYTNAARTEYEIDYTDGIELPIGEPYKAETAVDWFEVFSLDESEMDPAYKIIVNPSELADFTLRELQTAVYETVCQFGQLSRLTDLFSGVELNHSRLYPADSLYPATDLYPDGAAVSGFKSMYSKLWADEGNIHKWRYLIITYKGLDGEGHETDFTLQRTINADGTDDYNMSDNWLFKNLVWTAADIGDYADAMVAKMQDVTWFPFEMWCAGLPYLETGDEIEISLNGESYISYVLQRQLKGIQNLQDTYINGTLDIF